MKQIEAEILEVLNNENQYSEKKDLHWNLFNRKFNFLKCFIMHIQTSQPNNQCFWEDALNYINEIYGISINLLQESYSRHLLLNYFKHLILRKIGVNDQQIIISMNNQEIIQQILVFFKQEEDELNPQISLKSTQNLTNSKKKGTQQKNVRKKGKQKNTYVSNFVLNPQDNSLPQNPQKSTSLYSQIDNRTISARNKTDYQRKYLTSFQSAQLSMFSNVVPNSLVGIISTGQISSNDIKSSLQNYNVLNISKQQNEDDFLSIQLLERLSITYKVLKDSPIISFRATKDEAYITNQDQINNNLSAKQMINQKRDTDDSIQHIQHIGQTDNPDQINYVHKNNQQIQSHISFQNHQFYSNIQSENKVDNYVTSEQQTHRKKLTLQEVIQETEQPLQIDSFSEPEQQISPIIIKNQNIFNPLILKQQSSTERQLNNDMENQQEQDLISSPLNSPIVKLNKNHDLNSPVLSIKLTPVRKTSDINNNTQNQLQSDQFQFNSNNLSPIKEQFKEKLNSFSINNLNNNNENGKSFLDQERSKNETIHQSACFMQPDNNNNQNLNQNQNFLDNQSNQEKKQNNNELFTPPTLDYLTTGRFSPEMYINSNQQISNPQIKTQTELVQKQNPQHNTNYSNQKKRDEGSKTANNSRIKQNQYSPYLNQGSQGEAHLQGNTPSPQYPIQMASKDVIARYEFPPDILCQHVIDMDTDLLLKEQNFILAAKILTTCLEQSQTFFSQLKFSLLCKLRNIFSSSQITSQDLQKMINNFNPNIFFKIQFVSCCTTDSGKFESISIVQGIIDQIISKNGDRFGFIDYQEPLYEQVIAMMTKKSIESSKNIIHNIIDKLQPPEMVAYQLEKLEKEKEIEQYHADEYFRTLEVNNNQENDVKQDSLLNQSNNSQIDQSNKKHDSIHNASYKNQQNQSIHAKSGISSVMSGSFIGDTRQKQSSLAIKADIISNDEISPELKNRKRRQSRKQTTRKYTLVLEGAPVHQRSSKKQTTLIKSQNQQANNSSNSDLILQKVQSLQNDTTNLQSTLNSPQSLQVPNSQSQKRSSFNLQQNQKQLSTFQSHRASLFAREDTDHYDQIFENIFPQQIGPKLIYKEDNGETKSTDELFEFGSKGFLEFQKKEQSKVQRDYSFQSNLQFHLGIRKALLNFQDLNYQTSSDFNQNQEFLNQNIFVPEKKLDLTVFKQDKFATPFSFSSQILKKFIIFSTDITGIKKTKLFESLIKILFKNQIILLVLLLNETDSVEEQNNLSDQYYESECVIKFFFEGEKLLQFLFNQRETSNIHLFPLIVEHY